MAGMGSEAPARVAVYERTVHASLERIWENVLDWEHLPWLHRSSFLGVRMLDESREHWDGWITVPSRKGPADSRIDTRLDRPRLRYLVRTLEGSGAGSEILTRLDPVGERETRIAVEFRVPGVAGERAASLGEAYVELYTGSGTRTRG